MGSGPLIEAAGGVLWRPALGGAGVEIALVHRPKYDDWSLPKGKLEPGEPGVLGGVREIVEETGYSAVPGRPLGEIRYLKDGDPKRVRYWSMRAVGGGFQPNAEVDQVMWLPPREALQHLAADRDGPIVTEYARDPDPTWPVIVVRHASAGDRSSWPGEDRERPLDDVGRDQAHMLVPFLSAYQVEHVLSADVLRCLETVGPYALRRRRAVQSEPLLSESGFAEHPAAAVERLLGVIAMREPVVACSQGESMPSLVAAACAAFGVAPPRDSSCRKGGGWVFHFASNGKPRLLGLERFEPLA
jgi:8-oxo-dGTP pyrophosphatase MutT (NUDIX family)/phosphohistidine phosphatase SixA